MSNDNYLSGLTVHIYATLIRSCVSPVVIDRSFVTYARTWACVETIHILMDISMLT